jgi:uncharacterized protein (TIGR02145 family)
MFKLGLFPFGPTIPTTVDIGTQTWKIKNLSTTTYRNGDPIFLATNTTEWKNFDTAQEGCYASVGYDSANDAEYGLLYNGHAIKDPRQIAPIGYHIPTYSEMDELINYLGGPSSSGNAMKEVGTAHWITDFGNTNSSGYTDLGAGFINSGGFPSSFKEVSLNGTYDLDTDVYYYQNNANNGTTNVNSGFLNLGYSIRVVKNSSLSVGDSYGDQGIIASLDGNPNANNFLITIINNSGYMGTTGQSFGCSGLLAGATSLTDGAANTDILGTAACNTLFTTLSTNTMIDRFNDWYVPAADEATTLLNNLGVSLSVSGPYWTSTEIDTDDALYVSTFVGSSWSSNPSSKTAGFNYLIVRKQYV